MRGQQVLLLLIVLVAPAAAFHIVEINTQQVIRDDDDDVVDKDLPEVEEQKNSDEGKDGMVKSRWKAWFTDATSLEWRQRSIKGMYRFSAFLDVAILVLDQVSLSLGDQSSTSTYAILNGTSNEECRNNFRTALTTVDNEESFKAATKCITEDMDKFAKVIYQLDASSNGLSSLQSLLSTFMTYKEFTASLAEITKTREEAKANEAATLTSLKDLKNNKAFEALNQHTEKEVARLINLVCDAKLIDNCKATIERLQEAEQLDPEKLDLGIQQARSRSNDY